MYDCNLYSVSPLVTNPPEKIAGPFYNSQLQNDASPNWFNNIQPVTRMNVDINNQQQQQSMLMQQMNQQKDFEQPSSSSPTDADAKGIYLFALFISDIIVKKLFYFND